MQKNHNDSKVLLRFNWLGFHATVTNEAGAGCTVGVKTFNYSKQTKYKIILKKVQGRSCGKV